jgi:hypothetical protein
MPKIERWENFLEAVRRHLIDRMRDRAIGIADLNQLRLWVETKPEHVSASWSGGERRQAPLVPKSMSKRACWPLLDRPSSFNGMA